MPNKKFGRYEVIEEIGRGGMATVYLANDPRFKRDVAIKILPREFLHDPQFSARFEREAQTIAGLDHPSIVPVYDFGEEEGQPFIVIRYMTGGSLRDRLLEGPLSLSESSEILKRIGGALDHAHAQGVVHRDLKPANILFDQYGDAYLADFGIAHLVEASAVLTGTAAVIGTPAYMSPEQVQSETELDGRSDIYSLGIILFEMLTGEQPFQADTPAKVMMKHVLDPVPDVTELDPTIPGSVQTVLSKALAKEREERFSSVSRLIDSIEAPDLGPTIVEAEPTAQETVSERLQPPQVIPADQPAREKKTIPVWGWVLGGGAILILIVFLVLSSGGSPPEAVDSYSTQPAEPTQVVSASPGATLVPPLGATNIYVEYILDASGSMLELLQGKTKLEIAQDVLSDRLSVLPPDVNVGMRVYGHRIYFEEREESCLDIELVVPIQPNGGTVISDWLPGMEAQGMTPMSESLRLAAQDFTYEPNRHNLIVLLSDGLETCGDEPADVALLLQELGIDFTIHVIGLNVDAQARAQLARIAEVGKGVYHDAFSKEDLQEALDDIHGRVFALAAPAEAVLPTEEVAARAEDITDLCTLYPEDPNFVVSSEPGVHGSICTVEYVPQADGLVDGGMNLIRASSPEAAIQEVDTFYDPSFWQLTDAYGTHAIELPEEQLGYDCHFKFSDGSRDGACILAAYQLRFSRDIFVVEALGLPGQPAEDIREFARKLDSTLQSILAGGN